MVFSAKTIVLQSILKISKYQGFIYVSLFIIRHNAMSKIGYFVTNLSMTTLLFLISKVNKLNSSIFYNINIKHAAVILIIFKVTLRM